ncbi:MAG: LysM peptidoglycan-binding domain-containing protein [Deltaproteobacteria bacterium]|nr:LysM peptidoglycan-binding domain-containing protein [Deltaproteobacteria bacterium]
MTSKRSLILIFMLFLPHTVFAATKYVVKKGDSLYKLSKKFSVSVNDLKKANKLDVSNLDVGDVLLVPTSKNSTNNAASGSQREYVVAKGDTLSEIGEKFGVSANSIKVANNLNSNNLSVGQKLIIPSSSKSNYIKAEAKKETNTSAQEKKPVETKSNPSSVSTKYTVRKGDTLGGIANKYGVSVRKLKGANGLKSDSLKIGKVLIIPGSVSKEVARGEISPEPVLNDKKYVVKKGDSLYDVSKKFGVSIDSIKKANGLSNNGLKVGDTLLISGSKEQAASVNQSKYVVAKGDTLSEIGEKFGVSTNIIKKVNNLNSNSLRIGQKLIIPSTGSARLNVEQPDTAQKELTVSKSTQEEKPPAAQNNLPSVSIEYTVRKGDTLGVIANNFGVSVPELKTANGLRSDSLKAGKVLIIPGAVNKEVVREVSSKPVLISRRYVVKKGDSLHRLSKKFGTSITSIKEASGIKGNAIRIGQVLTIPGKEQYIDTYKSDLPESYSLIDNNHYDLNKADDLVSRSTIINVAKRFLGAPYKFGGTSPVRGIDCSAFVNKVFDFFNVDLPRTARDIYKVGRSVAKSELATGDLVFFRTYASYPSHVGIYIENDEFIHASSAAKKVTIDSINRSYYRKRYIGAKRIEVSGLFYGDLSQDYKGFEIQ